MTETLPDTASESAPAGKPYFDIVVPGNYFCDIIFTGFPNFPQLGHEVYTRDVAVVPGGVMNTVVALKRLGINVGWVGMLGNDFFSRFAQDAIEQEGVDTSLLLHRDEPLRRVTVAISFPHDRAFVTHVDPAPDVIDLVYSALDKVTFPHLHFTGLPVEERLPDLIRLCRERHITVSMDCQHREDSLEVPLVREIISMVDMFTPNAIEAKRLTGKDDIHDAMDVLSDLVPYVVIKNGAGGAICRHLGEDYAVPGLVLEAIDTTGAGDVFNAGLLAAHFRGLEPEECLHWANFCGGMSTLAHGGASSAPTLAALQSWMTDHPLR